jgi:hypothetical protein
MWKKYFSVVKIVPGPVVIPGWGEINFASDKIPLSTIQELYEKDCPYLRINQLGLDTLYPVQPQGLVAPIPADPIPVYPQSLVAPIPADPIPVYPQSLVAPITADPIPVKPQGLVALLWLYYAPILYLLCLSPPQKAPLRNAAFFLFVLSPSFHPLYVCLKLLISAL